MQPIDRLNLCESVEQVLNVLGDQRIDNYLYWNTGDCPNWLDLGQCELNNQTYGLSLTVQRYIVEYELLFDEAKNPSNRGEIEKPTNKGYSHLPRCNDAILMQLVIEDGRIKEVKWKGQGCTMCLSSVSLLTRAIEGKTIDEIKEMYAYFKGMMMLNGSATGVEETLLVFEPVKVNPMKVECIMVPWEALRNAIELNRT